jgi:hypothetical protein
MVAWQFDRWSPSGAHAYLLGLLVPLAVKNP